MMLTPDMEQESEQVVPVQFVKNLARSIQNFHHEEVVDLTRTGMGLSKTKLGRFTDKGELLYKPAEIEFISRKYCELFKQRQDHIQRAKTYAHYNR